MNVGLAGEFRCVVTKADGTIKLDTGYQKNLILNQGLDFFGAGNANVEINLFCAIGSGNSVPAITQKNLDVVVAIAQGTNKTSDYSYTDKGDDLYRMWEQKKYRYSGLSDVNISEVGLCSAGASTSNYNLTTRALIKDSSGSPTTISVKTGETLDIFYKIHKVTDISDKAYVVNMVNGDGVKTPYNVVMRAAHVGVPAGNSVASAFYHQTNNSLSYSTTNLELSDKTTVPAAAYNLSVNGNKLGEYTAGSYKRILTFNFGLNDGNNIDIRVLFFAVGSYSTPYIPFYPFQLRFGKVSDDAPIVKTNQETLSIPVEFSWGRYEGDL